MVPRFYELEVNLNYMLSWNIKYIERLVLSFQFLIYSPKYEIDVKSMWWLTFAVNLFQHLSIFHLILVLKLKIRLKNMQRIYIFLYGDWYFCQWRIIKWDKKDKKQRK